MVQLGAASKLYNWNLNFGDIASIWRGGCIIRARFLNRITDAYRSNPDLKNLILDPFFRDTLLETQANWRSAVTTAIEYGVAVPAFSSALSYFDSYRQANLPANLLQAQRDYFGAHTYERIDKPRGEFFHFDWLNP
jgi:6-phosphogluconate dehydrogenase